MAHAVRVAQQRNLCVLLDVAHLPGKKKSEKFSFRQGYPAVRSLPRQAEAGRGEAGSRARGGGQAGRARVRWSRGG